MATRPGSGGRAATRRRDRSRRRNRGSDLGARIVAAVPAIAFAIFIVAKGGLIFALGAAALGIVCLHELFDLTRDAHPVKLAGFVGLLALVLAALYGDQRQVLLIEVLLVPVVFGLALVQRPRGRITGSIAVTLLGLWWIGLAIAHAVLLRQLPHGNAIVIDVLVGTFIGDTGAYLGGRMFGSRPLAPAISPNKTVEGLLAGIVTAILATLFAGTYQDWLSNSDALLIGLGVALAAPVGDLFESLIKRDAGTKDTGRFFGPHGGALDRLDAVLFSIVAGYYVWAALV